jgi:subtilisin family serine protease
MARKKPKPKPLTDPTPGQPKEPSPSDVIAGGAAGAMNDPEVRRASGLPEDEETLGHYVVELNLIHEGGLPEAEKQFGRLCEATLKDKDWQEKRQLDRISTSYFHCLLSVAEWRELLRRDEAAGGIKKRAIYRIWPDYEVQALIDQSISTIKADAARRAFDASGRGIVWAVVDSGVDAGHSHFAVYKTLSHESIALLHRDFTLTVRVEADRIKTLASALTDPLGHGTHVAGIIAGGLPEAARPAAMSAPKTAEVRSGGSPPGPDAGALGEAAALAQAHDPTRDVVNPPPRVDAPAGPSPATAPGGRVAAAVGDGAPTYRVFQKAFDYDQSGTRMAQKIEPRSVEDPSRLRGVAPHCKIVSLRVLNEQGRGRSSNVMKALQYVSEVNGEGKVLVIHGVNLSIGYEFDAEIFACGQSPLCAEVDRLVRSGVVVVAAAGNTGYGEVAAQQRRSKTGLMQTINDPGNADRAITVGATHRDSPHTFGVSYFSSKGPTGDGRLKPDLVAPGERITSCATGSFRAEIKRFVQDLGADVAAYLDRNGTSMAAPHVSGAIAAFLSIRREFIHHPEEVKRIFLDSAMTLRRERYFEGHGMVDLMRAIQSV